MSTAEHMGYLIKEMLSLWKKDVLLIQPPRVLNSWTIPDLDMLFTFISTFESKQILIRPMVKNYVELDDNFQK